MKNNDRVMVKRFRVGELSSKYAYDYDGRQFEADMEAHANRDAFLWDAFVGFMKDNDVDPREFRHIFRRYYDEFIA